jgi:hypothetical protein
MTRSATVAGTINAKYDKGSLVNPSTLARGIAGSAVPMTTGRLNCGTYITRTRMAATNDGN